MRCAAPPSSPFFVLVLVLVLALPPGLSGRGRGRGPLASLAEDEDDGFERRRDEAQDRAARPISGRSQPARLSVDVAPVTDLDDRDDEPVVLDLVEDPVAPLSKAVALLRGELLDAGGAGIRGKGLDGLQDAADLRLREPPQILRDRRADDNPIASHRASALSRRPRNRGPAHLLAPRTRRGLVRPRPVRAEWRR